MSEEHLEQNKVHEPSPAELAYLRWASSSGLARPTPRDGYVNGWRDCARFIFDLLQREKA